MTGATQPAIGGRGLSKPAPAGRPLLYLREALPGPHLEAVIVPGEGERTIVFEIDEAKAAQLASDLNAYLARRLVRAKARGDQAAAMVRRHIDGKGDDK